MLLYNCQSNPLTNQQRTKQTYCSGFLSSHISSHFLEKIQVTCVERNKNVKFAHTTYLANSTRLDPEN